jgi:hypothetical protein
MLPIFAHVMNHLIEKENSSNMKMSSPWQNTYDTCTSRQKQNYEAEEFKQHGSPASNKADMPSTGSSLAFSLADKSFYETPYDNIKNS